MQGRQPVAGLFKAGAKRLRQPIDVMAHLAGGGPERIVRHQQRSGGVIAQPDVEQLLAGIAAEVGIAHDLGNFRCQVQRGQLVGQLEAPAFGRLPQIDAEGARCWLKSAQRRAPRIGQRYAEFFTQIAFQRLCRGR